MLRTILIIVFTCFPLSSHAAGTYQFDAEKRDTITLSCDPPTTYTDGSLLPSAEIASFKFYSWTSSTPIEIAETATCEFVTPLEMGVTYYAASTLPTNGKESALSVKAEVVGYIPKYPSKTVIKVQ